MTFCAHCCPLVDVVVFSRLREDGYISFYRCCSIDDVSVKAKWPRLTTWKDTNKLIKEQIQGFRLCLIEDSLSQSSPGAGLWLILLCENLGQVWFGCSYSVARQWEQFVKHKTQTCASKTEEIITISAREHDITLLLSIWESTTLTGVQSTFTAGINNRAVRKKTLYADI